MAQTETPFSAETILDLLRREGMRITKARVGLVHALFAATEPLALQELQTAAEVHSGVKPDYATVFRMIASLEKLHIVHKVNLQRACSYYELSDPRKHYDHLVCRVCGHVVLLDIPCPIGDAERNIAKRYGFRDVTHSLEFFGTCPDCESGPASARGCRHS